MRNSKFILALFVILGTGCQSSASAPFHIYDSPLLNAENHPSQRRAREYDPFEAVGDHISAEPVYAINDGPTTQPQPVTEPAKSPAKKRGTPSLSIKGAGAVGGHEGTASHAVSSDAPGVYQPSYAAAYVTSVLAANGVNLSAGAKSSIPKIYKECKKLGKVNHAGKPAIGDLGFFHNVQDANTDGRNNDWYGHVGVVELVHADGTVVLVGWSNGKLEKKNVNLAKPESTTDGSHVFNSQLRSPGGKDAPFTQYFASELFAGYCSVLGDKKDLILIDNWQPGDSK